MKARIVSEIRNNEEVFPRKGSDFYHRMQSSPSEWRRHRNKQRRYNKWFMVPLYKIRILPLFGLGKFFVLLTTKGRKSQKKRTTPVGYFKIDEVMHLVSANPAKRKLDGKHREADWMQNIRAYPDDVWVQAGFRSFHANMQIVDDPKEKEKVLRVWFTKYPKTIGLDPKLDDIQLVDLTSLVEFMTIVKILPSK